MCVKVVGGLLGVRVRGGVRERWVLETRNRQGAEVGYMGGGGRRRLERRAHEHWKIGTRFCWGLNGEDHNPWSWWGWE